MRTLNVTLKVVTPLFCSGAEQFQRAEFRIPSLKGVLRFWYRAIDPEFNQNASKNGPTFESKIFGGSRSKEGRSTFSMRLKGQCYATEKWDKNRDSIQSLAVGHGKESKNGIIYFSYPFDTGRDESRQQRAFVSPGRTLQVAMAFNQEPDLKTMRAIAAAWWLFGHIGGLGARVRRGFGSIALQSWEISGLSDSVIGELPIAHGQTQVAEWTNRFEHGLRVIKSWFAEWPRDPDHTVIGPGSRFFLFKTGFAAERKLEPWERALNAAGLAMQTFRQRYGKNGGDYANVLAHLAKRMPNIRFDGETKYLQRAPERAAFGLPLAFQFSSLRGPGSRTTFVGASHDRNASPLFVRVVEIGKECFPFYALLNAPLLARGEQIREQKDRDAKFLLPVPSKQILNKFCDEVLRKWALREVAL